MFYSGVAVVTCNFVRTIRAHRTDTRILGRILCVTETMRREPADDLNKVAASSVKHARHKKCVQRQSIHPVINAGKKCAYTKIRNVSVSTSQSQKAAQLWICINLIMSSFCLGAALRPRRRDAINRSRIVRGRRVAAACPQRREPIVPSLRPNCIARSLVTHCFVTALNLSFTIIGQFYFCFYN